MTPDSTKSDSETSPSGPRRYQMLDVWRGLVCLVVVLEHVGVVLWPFDSPQAAGWDGWLRGWLVSGLTWNFGSPLFFVMSGYCIASSLDSSRRRGDSPGRFLYRRFWRIYPTYWAALLAFVGFVVAADAFGLGVLHRNAVSLEVVSPAELDASQWLGNLTLTETWRPHLGGSPYASVFTRVAWSLCYQEQFYLICVLAFWLAPGRLDWMLAGATVVIAAFRLAAQDAGSFHYLEGTFPVYWHVFAVGLAVYWRLNLASGSPAWARRSVELGLAVLASEGVIQGKVAMTAPFLFGLLLIVMRRWDAAATGLVWLAPVRACGRRSFSIYLIHLPMTMVGNAALVGVGLESFWVRALVILPAVTVASVALGWAFHHVIEKHFLGQPPALRGGAHSLLSFGGRLLVRPA